MPSKSLPQRAYSLCTIAPSDEHRSHATVKRRREARAGYVTLEGFWEDPPGYVDKIVWPNYVNDHAFLFVDGKVEGTVNESARENLDLKVMPRDFGSDITKCLEWACEILRKSVRDSLAS